MAAGIACVLIIETMPGYVKLGKTTTRELPRRHGSSGVH